MLCSIYRGWTGDDCSRYHCDDVDRCSGHGTCVGANQCQCSPGWYGRSCATTSCQRRDNCHSCVTQPGCGWCDSYGTCLPGNASASALASCRAWFFHECVTAATNSRCSGQISSLDCNDRYCRENVNKALCHQCKDIEDCYSNTTGCSAWNETRCPDGVARPNYTDPSRTDKVVFSDRLRLIKPRDRTLYQCTEYDDSAEDTQLLVAAGRLDVEAGDILASAQAGGIFHKLSSVTRVDHLTMMRAEMASLRSAIRYADFDADMQMYEMDDVDSLEEKPPMSLLDDITSGNVKLNPRTVVHNLDSVTAYKCLGKTYLTNVSSTGSTFNLVIKTDPQNKDQYKVGDVLTSYKTSGFLETILGTWSTSIGTVANTSLAVCNDLDLSKLKLSAPLRKTSCVGGDNNPGLLVFDDSRQVHLDVGDVVPGRESSEVLATVLAVRAGAGVVVLEVATVERVEDSRALTRVRTEDVRRGLVTRRRRDINLGISGSDTRTLSSGVRNVGTRIVHVCMQTQKHSTY